MSCVLDEDTFRLCCQHILHHSDTLRDGWSWELAQGSEEGYLRKTSLRSYTVGPDFLSDGLAGDRPRAPLSAESLGEAVEQQLELPSSQEEDDDDDDGACDVSEGSSRACQTEYHVLYSCSYNTPVLYFQTYTLDGRSLSLEDVWRSIPPNYRQRLQHSPWDTITQQEHPLLGQPFYVLHPCRTEDFMRPVMQAALRESRGVNYVVTWLSVVGPVVGLEVPLSYSTLVPAPSHPTPAPPAARCSPGPADTPD
ncbi:ubiquitin-like-conjugating enzyme ATG10 [Aplochiton taeniatus]